MNASLVVDLDSWAVGGLGLGRPIVGFNQFQVTPDECGKFEFVDNGIVLEIDEWHVLRTVILHFGADRRGPRLRMNPYRGSIIWKGKGIEFANNTPEREIKSLFGDPYCRYVGDELLLFFEYLPFEIVFVFDDHSADQYTLSAVAINNPPVLKDENHRQFYCAKVQWPPE